MDAADRPGPPGGDQASDRPTPGEVQPEAAEVESARMLANQARDRLKAEGFLDPTIDRLADLYVATDRSAGDFGDFVEWALAHREVGLHPNDPERTSEHSFPASDPPSTWTGAEPGSG